MQTHQSAQLMVHQSLWSTPMLVLSLLAFFGVAYAGYFMANEIRSKKGVLAPIRDLHRYSALGGLTVIGGVLLLTEQNGYVCIAGAILLAAALGGFGLFRVLFANKQRPMLAVYAHASLGVIGILTLIVAIVTPNAP